MDWITSFCLLVCIFSLSGPNLCVLYRVSSFFSFFFSFGLFWGLEREREREGKERKILGSEERVLWGNK